MEDMSMGKYLAMEQRKLLQGIGSSTKRLWFLMNEDDECETYEVDLSEFPEVRSLDQP